MTLVISLSIEIIIKNTLVFVAPDSIQYIDMTNNNMGTSNILITFLITKVTL